MQFKDYYDTLGVEPSAGEAEIKTAYRRLARKYHPDVSKEAGAEEKFKAVNEAYEALRDPQKRAAYDQLRARGYRPGDEVQPPPGGFGGGPGGVDFEEIFAGGGAGGGFSDFFETLFGRGRAAPGAGGFGQRGAPPRGDTRAKLAVSLETVYEGGQVRISVNHKTLDVRVPKGASLDVDVVSAPLNIDGIEGGKIKVNTVSGKARTAICCWKSNTPRTRSSRWTGATSSTCSNWRRGKRRWAPASACRPWAGRSN